MTVDVVLFSGGLDSTTLLWQRMRRRHVVAFTVNYGQRHDTELDAAWRIIDYARRNGMGVQHVVVDLRSAGAAIFRNALSSQVGQRAAVPEGHYEEKTMARTVVPNRNMILLSLATAYIASSDGVGTVYYAAHHGDHVIYHDCRVPFITAMRDAVRLATNNCVELAAPFAMSKKHDIVRIGVGIGVPYELTYSCYAGGGIHCGKCGTCVERREAFKLAGVDDPTEYGR